jgi:hypothetical protein
MPLAFTAICGLYALWPAGAASVEISSRRSCRENHAALCGRYLIEPLSLPMMQSGERGAQQPGNR